MRVDKLGGLTVRITGGTDGKGAGAGPLVVLLHGFGAPGDDLVALSEYLDAPAGTRFLFPEAPISIPMGFGDSRAWWMIDMARIQADRAAGKSRDMSNEIPRGLPEARERMKTLLDDIYRKFGADPARTVLGGFSQGAMLSCDALLHSIATLCGLDSAVRNSWLPSRNGIHSWSNARACRCFKVTGHRTLSWITPWQNGCGMSFCRRK